VGGAQWSAVGKINPTAISEPILMILFLFYSGEGSASNSVAGKWKSRGNRVEMANFLLKRRLWDYF